MRQKRLVMGFLLFLLILPLLIITIHGESVTCDDVEDCTGDMECVLGGYANGCVIDCIGGGVIECLAKKT